jgi:predicted nucleotidyltransferase component of viral defense system
MSSNKILTPIQEGFLNTFFKNSEIYDFYLGGGTALSAFYLEHRLSDDIDLFADSPKPLEDVLSLRYRIDTIAKSLKCFLTVVDESNYHCRYNLEKGDYTLRIDFACDPCKRLRPVEIIQNIPVMSKDDIAANKIRLVSSRRDIKDFIDLYFLNKSGYSNKHIISLAKEKDSQIDIYKVKRGFERFIEKYEKHAGTIKFPKILVEFDSGDFKRYVDGFSKELSLKLREDIKEDIKPDLDFELK